MSFDGIELLVRTHEVVTYLAKLSHLLDEFDIDGFVNEFTDDGTYKLIPRENYERGMRIHIIDDDKNRMKYRRDLIRQHWHYEKFREARFLSGFVTSFPTRETSDITSTFSVYTTNAEGASSLHLVGKFRDRLVFDGKRWRIKDRLAILDTFLPDKAIVVPP